MKYLARNKAAKTGKQRIENSVSVRPKKLNSAIKRFSAGKRENGNVENKPKPMDNIKHKRNQKQHDVAADKVTAKKRKSLLSAIKNENRLAAKSLTGTPAKKIKRESSASMTELDQVKVVDGKSPNLTTMVTAAVDGSEEKPKNKKRRPWRQAVRHQARQLRKEEESDVFLPAAPLSTEAPVGGAEPSKHGAKNRRRKEKRRRLRDGLLDDGPKIDAESKDNEEKEVTLESKMDASRFRFINEKLYTSTSDVARQLFAEDREAYDAYHRGYRVQAKSWPINPVDKMIRDLAALPPATVVADVGCGDAKIAEQLGDQLRVHSFDLVAANKRVTVADMARLPLDAGSVDVAVYCLSLMGTNLSRFLREANRILKVGGRLKICEVSSRFKSVPKFTGAVERLGFKLKMKKNLAGYFVVMSFAKIAEPETRRPMGLVLNPCLYKKR